MEFPDRKVPGINPNANRGPELNVVATAFICISLVTIFLHGFSRLYTQINFGLDDLLIAVAALSVWIFTALGIASVQTGGMEQRIGKKDVTRLEYFLKLVYGAMTLFPIALTLSKLSLLALYWRIFKLTTGRRPLQIVAALNIMWMIAAIFAGVFLCVPIDGFWDLTKPSRCVNYDVMFIATEAITLALELFVLLLPIYFIAQINRSLSQRLAISSTFLLGLVATVISAIRLWQLIVELHFPGLDPTYNETNSQLYGDIELNMWILVASVPALRPLLGKLIRDSQSKGSASAEPKRHWYIFSSLSGLRSRLLGKYGRSSRQGHGQISLSGSELVGVESTPVDSKWPNLGPWVPTNNDLLYSRHNVASGNAV